MLRAYHDMVWYDDELKDMLRAYRFREAGDRGISPYRVFHDETLQDLVETKPRYPKALEDIHRFGPKTIGAHGKGVLLEIDRWADKKWGPDDRSDLDDHPPSDLPLQYDSSVFESILGNSKWTRVLSQLYLSFSNGRPRVTSKDLVERSGCSEETVRRVLVKMEDTRMILRGGRGEGHMLNWKRKRIENLILSLERIEGKSKGEEILHLIRHLNVKDAKHREDEIEVGLLKSLDGDPASLDGYLEDRTKAALWAKHSLTRLLETTGIDYTTRQRLNPINGEDARDRGIIPDAAVRLPGGELLCIDAKLPLYDFRDGEFFGRMKFHIRKVAGRYVEDEDEKKKLNEKNEKYIPEYEKYGTTNYCIIYIPSEEIFSYISSNQPDIFGWSMDKHRVLLASPFVLVSLLKTIELASQNLSAVDESQEELRDNMESIKEHNEYLFDTIKELSHDLRNVTQGIEAIQKYRENFARKKMMVEWEKLRDISLSSAERMAKAKLLPRPYRKRMASRESQIIILQALVELHERKKLKYIPRSELRAEAKTLGLERSNSRFSQILSNLEEDGLIARKSLGDVELGSIGVTLRPLAQYKSYVPNSKKRIAELFDDEGKFRFES